MICLRFFAFALCLSALLPVNVLADEEIPIKSLESPFYIFPRSGSQHTDLSCDWKLTSLDSQISTMSQLEGADWIPVKTPTSVQMAYFKAGRLPDPYANLNSEKYEYLEQKVHYYRKTFAIPVTTGKENIMLSFDGIDYACRVWLNGIFLGKHEGMFGGPMIRINDSIKHDGSDNEIVVEVVSANFSNPSFAAHSPGSKVRTWFFSRGSVTPFFHVGMWNGVHIDIVPEYHIERPFLSTREIKDGKAVIDLSAELFAGKTSNDYTLHPFKNSQLSFVKSGVAVEEDVSVRFDLREGSKIVKSVTFKPKMMEGRSWIEDSFILDSPKLWHPNGMGEPFLYRVEVSLSVAGNVVDRIDFDFGVRTIDHIRSAGLRTMDRWNDWQFVVNGEKIFVKGMNWMPLDALSDLPYERYEWTLRAARDMGVQLIRIWGSGYLETEKFYDICDNYGIMVWQDFTIANSETPDWPQDVWEAQVCQNIFRLRNRPSLAVWCGGNEFNPYSIGNTASIGIIERDLKEFDPTRPFWRTSPDGGSMHLYSDFDPNRYKDYSLIPFVAETGIHSMSSARNNRKIIAAEDFTNLGGIYEEGFDVTHPDFIHHFAEYHPSRVPRMLSRASHIEDIRNPIYEDLVEACQVGAGEFYQVMSESLQSNYPVTVGLMPWVFRRSWPVMAAIQLMDYFGQPTAPYYFLKRTYEKTHVLMDLPRMLYAPGDVFALKANIINGAETEASSCSLSVRILNDKFKIVWNIEKDVNVPAGTSVTKIDLGDYTIPENYREKYFFVIVELRSPSGGIISRQEYWPRTIKQMEDSLFHDKYLAEETEWPTLNDGPWLKPTIAKCRTNLDVGDAIVNSDGTVSIVVTNTGRFPSPITTLDVDDCIYYSSDNFFWLEPGESKNITLNIKDDGNSSGELLIKVLSWNSKTMIRKIKKQI